MRRALSNAVVATVDGCFGPDRGWTGGRGGGVLIAVHGPSRVRRRVVCVWGGVVIVSGGGGVRAAK